MFELIKLLVEKVVGQISFESITKRRKDEKLATIGSELMLLYMSLNGVVVVGQKIIDVLRQMAECQNQEGNSSADELKTLVRYQAEQLVRVIASCHRLSSEIGVVDETGGRVLSTLLDIKVGLLRNLICELWPDIWDPSSGTSQLLGFQGRTFLRSFNNETLDQVFASDDFRKGRRESEQAWDSGVQIPLDDQVHSDLARRFLDSGAEENLQAIAESTQQLRDQIEKHFSITDVLLKVHDARAITADPNRILWDAYVNSRFG